MKITLSLFLTLFFSAALTAQSDCDLGNSYAELDINNVRAGLRHSGSLWWDGFDGKYIAPDPGVTGGAEVSAIFAGGLWLAAKDESDNIRLAAQQYAGFGGTDFFPGPLDAQTGEAIADACQNWDRHFSVLRSEIEAHILDFAIDGTIDDPVAAVFTWPGRNNPDFFSYTNFELPSQDLAPFVDVNSNGIYEPALGDYPDVKGDQAIWWVFNDAAYQHSASQSTALGLEVQMIAYAFESAEPAVNNATFYEMKYINRSTETLTDFQAALWVDNDLGCYTDDAFGFDAARNMAFYYNIDAVDGIGNSTLCSGIPTYGEVIPMLGIQLVEDSEDMGISSFMYFLNSSVGGSNPAQTDPPTPVEYVNYMNATWRDGTPLTEGGNGYGGDTPTSFAFPGNPADVESGWSFCSAGISESFDSRTIMSTGGITLAPGGIRTQTYAVLFTEDVPHPCPDVSAIQEAADIVEDSGVLLSSQEEPSLWDNSLLELYPNPNQGSFNIELSTDLDLNTLEIYDARGKMLLQQNAEGADTRTEVNTNLPQGVYFVRVQTSEGQSLMRKFVVQ